MTISAKCTVCKNADRRRLIELAWNGGMEPQIISNLLEGTPTPGVIAKHLNEHTDGDNLTRTIVVAPVRPARERVLALQTLQLDEVERRLALAIQRATDINAMHEGEEDWEPRDWSDYFDILSKDMQAAVSSILKSQGISDKREKAVGDLKLGLFEAMANAGLAPKSLVSGTDVPLMLPVPQDVEHEDEDA